ncbi:MAG: TrkA family potassium uptake protein [Sulfurovum sp.]|nr:MAG: TrkA family potassium uptake protein [Sulfurovum sp.]
MFRQKAFMFGYSQSRLFLAKELGYKLMGFSIIVNDEKSYQKAILDGYSSVRLLDVTDDRALEELPVKDNDYLICVMDDHYLNVFLTLSLHELFPKAIVVALSDSPHTTQKLKMAGASRIIDLYQVSANRIHNILHKPVATKLVERLLSSDEDFSFKEMEIPKGSSLDGVMVDDFDFTLHGVILVGMIDKRLSNQFIFITSGLENRFDVGDTIVCIGYNADLEKFEDYIKL